MNIDLKNASTILSDLKTHMMVSANENYYQRLKEAYEVVKASGVRTYEEFRVAKLGIGAFSYTDILYFERIDNNPDYFDLLSNAAIDMKTWIPAAENNPLYGDDCAKWANGIPQSHEDSRKQGR